jgi:hypothetical protein
MRLVDRATAYIVKERMDLAINLKQLCDIFCSSSANARVPMKEFYAYLDSNCSMSKRNYLNHQTYFNFMNKHQRFQLLPVSFTAVLAVIPSIEAWFRTDECSCLSPNNYSPQAFWKEITNIIVPTFRPSNNDNEFQSPEPHPNAQLLEISHSQDINHKILSTVTVLSSSITNVDNFLSTSDVEM